MLLEQVFLYVTSRCHVGCLTCYMKDTYRDLPEMPLENALSHLNAYRDKGASKLSILGGEPTLYPYLEDLILKAKAMGYSFVRINTNGQFPSDFLKKEGIQELNTICFSVDGHTDDLNAQIRLESSLRTILKNMALAQSLGYDVRVNCTLTSLNINHVSEIITLAADNGASLVYLNLVYMMGAATKHSYLAIPPLEWLPVYEKIVANNGGVDIRIKIPPGYTIPGKTTSIEGVAHKCFATEGSRIYILPNGRAFPCLLFFSSPSLQIKDDYANYIASLENHTGATIAQLNSWCHFFSPKPDLHLPLCIYHKRRLNYPNNS